MELTITKATRRAIFGLFRVPGMRWNGRLQENEFLGRLFDLNSMPSADRRFPNADSEIIQHRAVWNDWSDDWLADDPRFRALHESDEIFLRFLCETVHPAVRPDTGEALSLAEYYNLKLMPDGWRIFETRRISGKPVFGYQRADGICYLESISNN